MVHNRGSQMCALLYDPCRRLCCIDEGHGHHTIGGIDEMAAADSCAYQYAASVRATPSISELGLAVRCSEVPGSCLGDQWVRAVLLCPGRAPSDSATRSPTGHATRCDQRVVNRDTLGEDFDQRVTPGCLSYIGASPNQEDVSTFRVEGAAHREQRTRVVANYCDL